MAKVIKVKARVKPVTNKPTYEEVRQELRCMEQDYDNLLMDYEDLNRDYKKEVSKVVELEAKIAKLEEDLLSEQRQCNIASIGVELWQDMHRQVSHEKAVEAGRAARAERILEMIGAWTPIELAMYFGDNKPMAVAIEEQKAKLFPFTKPRDLEIMEGELQ